MKFLSFLVVFLLFSQSFAQDTSYARKIINDLCAKSFSGRGYVNKGDKKAANYIVKELKSIGVKPFNTNFLQDFKMSVNTFPNAVEVTYNGKKLIPGVDFIVDPSSPSIDFEADINFIPFSDLVDDNYYDLKGRLYTMAVIDTFSKNSVEAAISSKKYSSDFKKKFLVKLTNDKLTWSSSSKLANTPSIIMLSSSFDRSKSAHFKVKIKNKFFKPYVSQNVIGFLEGTKFKDSFIVVTAHYDHLGMMGKNAIFPGANDNASGIAMLLNLAKYYKNNPQNYSIVFIAFSGEETGLVGSKFFVDNPLFPLSNIHFLINIDLMGNGADGVMAVNGLVFPKEFVLLKKVNSDNQFLPDVKARGKAPNSDHYWFSEAGVPCFFFYLMGPYPYYHDVNDVANAVPLTNFSQAFLLFSNFINALQKPYSLD